MREDAAPGPSTQASAPKAPGCLGRVDARSFRDRTLSYSEFRATANVLGSEPSADGDFRPTRADGSVGS